VSNVLKIGLPKGSLQEATMDLLQRAGFPTSIRSRSYFPDIGDPEVEAVLFRPQEMSRYVEDGILDAGLTGHDWVVENDSDVVDVCELVYAKQRTTPVRWVLAVPAESDVNDAKQLAGGIVATELVSTTRRWFAERGVDVKIEFSWGATEAKARLVSAIVDVTETGSSLRANNLRIIDTVQTSTTVLVANKESWQDGWKRDKIEQISMNLQGALAAKDRLGLKLNVEAGNLDAVLKLLPALKRPTVNSLAEDGWHAVETVVTQEQERELVPRLRRAGAEGILVYELKKVIP